MAESSGAEALLPSPAGRGIEVRVGASRVSKIAKRQSAGDVIAPHVPTLTPTPLPMGEGLFAGVIAALLQA